MLQEMLKISPWTGVKRKRSVANALVFFGNNCKDKETSKTAFFVLVTPFLRGGQRPILSKQAFGSPLVILKPDTLQNWLSFLKYHKLETHHRWLDLRRWTQENASITPNNAEYGDYVSGPRVTEQVKEKHVKPFLQIISKMGNSPTTLWTTTKLVVQNWLLSWTSG